MARKSTARIYPGNIRTKPSTEEYRKGWDRTFGKEKRETVVGGDRPPKEGGAAAS